MSNTTSGSIPRELGPENETNRPLQTQAQVGRGSPTASIHGDNVAVELRIINSALHYAEMISPAVCSRVNTIDSMALIQGTIRALTSVTIGDGRTSLFNSRNLPELKVGPTTGVLNCLASTLASVVAASATPGTKGAPGGSASASSKGKSQKTSFDKKSNKQFVHGKDSAKARGSSKSGGKTPTVDASKGVSTISEKQPKPAGAEPKRDLFQIGKQRLLKSALRSMTSAGWKEICAAMDIDKKRVEDKISSITIEEFSRIKEKRERGMPPLSAIDLITDQHIRDAVGDWAKCTDVMLLQDQAKARMEAAVQRGTIQTGTSIFNAVNQNDKECFVEQALSVNDLKGGIPRVLNNVLTRYFMLDDKTKIFSDISNHPDQKSGYYNVKVDIKYITGTQLRGVCKLAFACSDEIVSDNSQVYLLCFAPTVKLPYSRVTKLVDLVKLGLKSSTTPQGAEGMSGVKKSTPAAKKYPSGSKTSDSSSDEDLEKLSSIADRVSLRSRSRQPRVEVKPKTKVKKKTHKSGRPK